jgi:cytochrome P450
MGTKFLKDEKFYELFHMPKNIFCTIDPELHRQRRSLINPSFSRRSILEYESLIQDKVRELCRRFKEHEDEDRIVDLYKALGAFTTDVVTEVAYGRSYKYVNCLPSSFN